MNEWQKQMINAITTTNPNYDHIEALRLANEWNNTDEKWSMIMDTFALSAHDRNVDRLVDYIENKFEKILKSNKENLDQNAQCWMFMCDE
jgi:hypothetical protein